MSWCAVAGFIAAQSARSAYQTNIKNCVVHSFEKRQAAYLRARARLAGVPGERAPLLARLINGNRVAGEEWDSLTLAEAALVGEERRLLGLDWDRRSLQPLRRDDAPALVTAGGGAATELWREDNPSVVWRAYHRWLTVLEAVTHESAFNLVPLPRIRASHLTIDTTLLGALMRQAGLTDLLRDDFSAERDLHWRSVFKLTGLRGDLSEDRRFCFAHLVKTDGVSLSIHFQAPRTDAERAAHAASNRWAKRLAAVEAAKQRRLRNASGENVRLLS